jgi:hypothetical protein
VFDTLFAAFASSLIFVIIVALVILVRMVAV